MGKLGKTSGAAVLCLVLCAGPALADVPDCLQAEISAAALKGLQKAAKREFADALDLATLHYCADDDQGHATVETVPVPRDDGSEDRSTLRCTGFNDRQRGWYCQVNRYQAIRVAPGAGQTEVGVEVSERASIASTREHALEAFALLNAPGRVEGCRGTLEPGQTTQSLRAILARRSGPYRLVISREGFALLREVTQVRFRAGGIDCWQEEIMQE